MNVEKDSTGFQYWKCPDCKATDTELRIKKLKGKGKVK